MKQTKLVFLDENREIHQDYLRIMSKYKEEVRNFKLQSHQDEPGREIIG